MNIILFFISNKNNFYKELWNNQKNTNKYKYDNKNSKKSSSIVSINIESKYLISS